MFLGIYNIIDPFLTRAVSFFLMQANVMLADASTTCI